MLGQDPLHFRIAAALFGLASLWALNRFFVRLRRDRLLADTPLVRIRSAAQGYVKVAGRASPAGSAPIASPLSLRPCVWWKYELAHEERDEKGNTHWHTVERAASVELFTLTDEDAQCLVGPINAEITPSTRDIWYGSRPRPQGPPPPSSSRLASGPWRYTEQLLSPGDWLSVMGELRSHSELDDLNSAVGEKLRQWKLDQARLLARFDTNHDGQIDAAEWEVARAAATREVQSPPGGVSRIRVISQPRGAEPYLIAPLSPERLEKREKLLAMAYFVCGLCGVVLCAWAIRLSFLLGGSAT